MKTRSVQEETVDSCFRLGDLHQQPVRLVALALTSIPQTVDQAVHMALQAKEVLRSFRTLAAAFTSTI